MIYLFVCYELIGETGQYPKLILVYRGNFWHMCRNREGGGGGGALAPPLFFTDYACSVSGLDNELV